MRMRHLWAGGVVLCLALVSLACDVKVGEGGDLSRWSMTIQVTKMHKGFG